MHKCGLSMYRGLQINYDMVNWERCCVMLRGCRHTVAVNPPSRCNRSDLTAADSEKSEVGWVIWKSKGGARWHIGRGRHKETEWRSRRESSWKMADSRLVKERGSHWSGDSVSFPAPLGADTSQRKVILLFPLFKIADCHSHRYINVICLCWTVSFLTFTDTDRPPPHLASIWQSPAMRVQHAKSDEAWLQVG